ncbi:hypothetical protein CROQUDRAFT_109121 [Cronartium quercuum f. sp. fusiforme G11]|uniref:Uncharacterized protein n=1 Tax=Cronartium quercuum f. sp. fusiforme G11 TaxID=708437 RepID=A0A9P6T9G1_9BASI|nr:hypothetical protein CROQUDRAFT_109121 [Cronartium quercuum f. sp. fusiforme G11]
MSAATKLPGGLSLTGGDTVVLRILPNERTGRDRQARPPLTAHNSPELPVKPMWRLTASWHASVPAQKSPRGVEMVDLPRLF